MELTWEFTLDCFKFPTCDYCIVKDIPKDKSINLADMNVIESLKEKFLSWGVTSVSLTGGEPTTYPKALNTLLRFFSRNGIRASIITNGLSISSEMLHTIIKTETYTGISLHIDGDLSTYLGSNRHLVTLGYTLSRKDLFLGFYVTVTNENISFIPEIVKYFTTLNLDVHFSEVTLRGAASRNTRVILSHDKHYWLKSILPDLLGPFEVDSSCSCKQGYYFVDSACDIYPCIESRHLGLDPIGNILKDSQPPEGQDYTAQCCYNFIRTENFTLLSNDLAKTCVFDKSSISSVESLKSALESLYSRYSLGQSICMSCIYPKCAGYIRVLPEEEGSVRTKADLIGIGESVTILDSFPRTDDGEIDTSVVKPVCKLFNAEKSLCLCHNVRPLDCCMYPIGLYIDEGGEISWILHTDCAFYDQLCDNDTYDLFAKDTEDLINSISLGLRTAIVQSYVALERISMYPYGNNRFVTLRAGI